MVRPRVSPGDHGTRDSQGTWQGCCVEQVQDLWQKNVQSCLLLCIFCVKTHHGLFPQGRRMPEQEAPLGCVTECSQVIQAAAFKESPLHSGSSCTSVLVIFLHYFIDDFLPIHFLYSLFMKFPLFEVQLLDLSSNFPLLFFHIFCIIIFPGDFLNFIFQHFN